MAHLYCSMHVSVTRGCPLRYPLSPVPRYGETVLAVSAPSLIIPGRRYRLSWREADPAPPSCIRHRTRQAIIKCKIQFQATRQASFLVLWVARAEPEPPCIQSVSGRSLGCSHCATPLRARVSMLLLSMGCFKLKMMPPSCRTSIKIKKNELYFNRVACMHFGWRIIFASIIICMLNARTMKTPHPSHAIHKTAIHVH